MSTKLPYFRWHPKDFDTDENVRLMTMCEVGLYVLCLNHAWVNGSLPDDLRKIAKIVGQPLAQVRKSWPAVSKCFEKTPDGVFINPRLERERTWARDKQQQSKDANKIRHSSRVVSGGEEKAKDGLPRAYDSESDSGSSVLETTTTEKTTSRARDESELDLEDPFHEFRKNSSSRAGQRKRVKLPPKDEARLDERAVQAERDHGRGDFRCAWIAFLEFLPTDEGLEIQHPFAFFLANVARWVPRSPPPRPQAHADDPGTQKSAPVGLPAPVVGWNATVTAAPYEWNGHAPRKRLTECETDPIFREKWPEAWDIAQRIHEARGNEVGWLTLPWALARGKDDKPPGWYRLLTEFRWMAEPASNSLKAPSPGVVRHVSGLQILDRIRDKKEGVA